MISIHKNKSQSNINDKKLYDDIEIVKNRDSKINLIFKFTSLILIFILVFTSLLLSPQTFFGVSKDYLSSVWLYDTEINVSLNFLNIWRFLILGFCILFPLVKNFFNIFFQRELIKKYSLFFGLYICISLISFFLLIFYNPVYSDILKNNNLEINNSSSIFFISLLLVPLFIINSSYHLFLFYFKRKTETLRFNKISVLIINIVSQFIFLILFIIFTYFITKTKTSQQGFEVYVASENEVYSYVKNLFLGDNTANIFVIIFSILLITILFFGSNLIKIFFIFSGEYNFTYFKNQIQLLFTLLASVLLWYFIILIQFGNYSALDINTINYGTLITFIIFLTIILALYLFLNLYPKIKLQGKNYNLLLFVIFQILIFSIFLFSSITVLNILSTRIIFFISFIFSWIITTVFLFKNKRTFLTSMLFLSTHLLLALLLITFQGWEILLTSANNFSTVVLSTKNSLTVVEIISITEISLFLALLIYSIVDIVRALFKISITKKNINKGAEHE
ncbi:MSC_0624 family F1-like ATPase-associated membrane protein [Mycoplasma sp. 1654_15]|uniref:MSC_0624 family F1-like ATPase-associated membrane protein n=1 Tax=Mycoplasma sp. 1654_15 TaxID=2725994 RepID=UPI001448DFF6|nr:hypothetical protein [Mycoplasma sp. 1654_15]QJB71540.1 hypothetical protein HF996_03740 [Mycoplasma sp. 1654_15]